MSIPSSTSSSPEDKEYMKKRICKTYMHVSHGQRLGCKYMLQRTDRTAWALQARMLSCLGAVTDLLDIYRQMACMKISNLATCLYESSSTVYADISPCYLQCSFIHASYLEISSNGWYNSMYAPFILASCLQIRLHVILKWNNLWYITLKCEACPSPVQVGVGEMVGST